MPARLFAFRQVVLSLLFFAACADVAPDGDAAGLKADSDTPGITTVNPNDSTSGGAKTAVLVFDPITAASGVAIRMRSDPTKCIARPRTSLAENDALILATCANDDRQAWAYIAGYFFANDTYRIGFAGSVDIIHLTGAPLVLRSFASQYAYFEMSGAAITAKDRAGGPQGWVVPQNDNVTVGVPLVADPCATNNQDTNWNLTGVGPNASRGTIVSVDASASSCLIKSGSSIVVGPCDVTQQAQRWLWPLGDLVAEGVSPGYVVGSMNQNTPILTFSSTISNTSSLNQGWSLTGSGIRYAGGGTTGSGSLYLSADLNSSKVTIATGNPSHTFWLGGTGKTVFK